MKKLPKIITKSEFQQLLDYTIKVKPRHWKEKSIAMLLGFEAGMRISEIVGLSFPKQSNSDPTLCAKNWKIPPLTKDNISIEKNMIRIEGGKGGKDRVVPLPKRFKPSYLSLLPLSIGRRGLQEYITTIGRKVLNKEITFHTLRHGFGSHLAGLGYPLHQIQMLMGHSRLDTTGIYLHANPQSTVNEARELF